MEALLSYQWPGNVRELRNAIERAVVLAENGRIAVDLFAFLWQAGDVARGAGPAYGNLPYREAMDKMTANCQRQYLLAVLRQAGGNVTRAAQHAGIERESFHRLMRKVGIKSEDVKATEVG